MFNFEIEYINSYGHIVRSFTIKGTEKQAIKAARKDKDLYSECHIEVICFESLKRIYA